MAESSLKEQHIYRLSAVDQSVSRFYITIALCFPCDHGHVTAASSRFVSATKYTISRLPILAGHLRPASDKYGADHGYLEVAVSLDMVTNFAPLEKDLCGSESNMSSYEALRNERFPVQKLEIAQFAELAQKPTTTSCPAFAVQLNSVPGGLIVVFQLHHAVADIVGMQTVLGLCSKGGEPRRLTHDVLSQQAIESSKTRDLLSDEGDVKPTAAPLSAPVHGIDLVETTFLEKQTVVLGFKLSTIDNTTAMVNARFVDTAGQQRKSRVSAFDVLAAILWRAVIRARKATGVLAFKPAETMHPPWSASNVIIPVNLRERFDPPLIKADYFGNAISSATCAETISSTDTAIDISALQQTASRIRIAIDSVNMNWLRTFIARIKISNYSNITPDVATASPIDVVIINWSDLLPAEGAHVSLGLGEPTFIRKLSSKDAEEACHIHPRPNKGDIWEVAVTMCEPVMRALLADEAVMKFVQFADGVKYVNGVAEEENAVHQHSLESAHQRNIGHRAVRGRLWMRGGQAGPSGT